MIADSSVIFQCSSSVSAGASGSDPEAFLPGPTTASSESSHDTDRPGIERLAGWLRLFVEPGQVVELLAFDVGKKGHTVGGFFDAEHLPDMAAAALSLSGRARGVYFTLNPLRPDLLDRSPNQVRQLGKGGGAEDADVRRRRWLFVDVDPVRPGGCSATDAEKAEAVERAEEVRRYLTERGWPEPIQADSGNGLHLLYRVDLPADDGGLVKRVLRALAARFDDADVMVDTKVFNPARIDKLYGTRACKGTETPDRPHRGSAVLHVPEPLEVVPRELLDSLAADDRPATDASAECDPSRSTGILDESERQALARQYVARVPPAIAGQGGDRQTFAVACTLVIDFDLAVEQALPLLREYNRRCQPPWTDAELLHKLEQADKKTAPRGKKLLTRPRSEVPSVTASQTGSAERTPAGNPFLGSIPDFVQADWLKVRALVQSAVRPRKPGRPVVFSGLRWLIHQEVVRQRRSEVVLPDQTLAQAVWGDGPGRRPPNWRQHLLKKLKVAFGNVRLENACAEGCLLHGTPVRHRHFVFRIPTLETAPEPNRAFLGVLELFGHRDADGVKRYDWTRPEVTDDPRTKYREEEIAEFRKAGRLAAVYLPALVFGMSPRAGLPRRQIGVLVALTRELTRAAKSEREDKAQVLIGGRLAANPSKTRPSTTASCPFLKDGRRYVGFNGNGRYQRRSRRGRGYCLIGRTRGGWLARAGYAVPDDEAGRWRQVRAFLQDLRALAGPFDLTAGAWAADRRQWLPLDELVGLTTTPAGRAVLKKCLLRVYAPEDYLGRWRSLFASRMGFSTIPGALDGDEGRSAVSDVGDTIDSATDLDRWMRRVGLTDQKLADLVGTSRSYVSAQRSGRKRWSERFGDRVRRVLSKTGVVGVEAGVAAWQVPKLTFIKVKGTKNSLLLGPREPKTHFYSFRGVTEMAYFKGFAEKLLSLRSNYVVAQRVSADSCRRRRPSGG